MRSMATACTVTMNRSRGATATFDAASIAVNVTWGHSFNEGGLAS